MDGTVPDIERWLLSEVEVSRDARMFQIKNDPRLRKIATARASPRNDLFQEPWASIPFLGWALIPLIFDIY